MGFRNLLARMFGTREDRREPKGTKSYGVSDNALYDDFQDVIAGCEFIAPLRLDTALSVLEHHGEVFNGPASKAPQYSPGGTGIWVPKTKSWAELGIIAREPSESVVASPMGPVKPSEYLPFLKAFRQIVESSHPHAEKLRQMEELPSRSPILRRFWEQHRASDPGFPKSYFCSELAESLGISFKVAEALYNAGLCSQESVRGAADAELLRIKGIGPSTMRKLKENTAGSRVG